MNSCVGKHHPAVVFTISIGMTRSGRADRHPCVHFPPYPPSLLVSPASGNAFERVTQVPGRPPFMEVR
jgi:hypothetical protein